MRIVLAPDSFKESLSAPAACEAMERGIESALENADVTPRPMSDGGEGMLDAVQAAIPVLTRKKAVVQDALGRPVSATWLWDSDRKLAVIESAAACGLAQIPPALRDAGRASSFGVGQLLRAALDADAREIIIGIGGSAMTDGGTGMASAIGYRFLDALGVPLSPGGASLVNLARVHAPATLTIKLRVACDVRNPLYGTEGAAAVYGPQKGATSLDVAVLDEGLRHLGETTAPGLAARPGSGAAGGLGFGLQAFCNADLEPGAALIADIIGLNAAISNSDLILTGEGRSDTQTPNGKACAFVCARAAALDRPCVVLSGSVSDELRASGLPGATILRAISPASQSLAEQLRDTAVNLERATRDVVAECLQNQACGAPKGPRICPTNL